MQQMFCIRCGNRLIEGDSFCRKCGTKISMPAAGPQSEPVRQENRIKIPSYESIKEKFDSPEVPVGAEMKDNPEGTVLLAGPGSMSGSFSAGMSNRRKAEIRLSFEELLRGCSKVVDFGTGTRYELEIPAGMSPGDTIIVQDTGIIDRDTGMGCEIELTVVMG